MEIPFEAGDKIQYRLFDKKGEPHWFKGVIHGVRRYEDPATNFIKNITYLVDTGRDERLDEHHFDHRDREISRRLAAAQAKNKSASPEEHADMLTAILKQGDLPPSRPDVEVFRQPEQIELPAEHIKAAA